MITPSALLRRRLGRVAIVVSTVFAGTFALWACGPFFPRWLLGPEQLLVPAPEGLLRHEIERLKLPAAPRAVLTEVDPWQQTAETDVAELARALVAARVPEVRRGPLVERYTEVRNALAQYASSVTVFANVSEPLYPEDAAGETGEPPVLPGSLTVPEGLPGEFADYLQGAIAYHRGDLGAATSAWERLLQRPEGERRLRSTWAGFMLGKAHLRAGRPGEAAGWFQRTREMAGQTGFEDSLGLAAGSLGWEARAERDLGHFDKALVLYARQAQGGDRGAAGSLRFVARQALEAGPDALASIAGSGEARSVMTAFLVSDASSPWDVWQIEEAEAIAAESGKPGTGNAVAAWLAALQKAGVKDVEGADRIAWAAYQGGEFAAARQWLDRAPADAPMARWIRAKLLLREGKLAEAQKLLDETAAALPDPRLTEDEVYRHNAESAGGKIATPTLASGESAALLTTEGKYVEALDRFLKSGFWMDAAHLAERVLPLDELKIYVDASWPASLIKDLPEYPTYEEGLQTALPGLAARDIRGLLGRRLVRAGRYDEAKGYLPEEMQAPLETLGTSLRQGADTAEPADRRAAALFRAACVTRMQGLELMGTELGPDWFLYEGQYEMPSSPGDLKTRAENPHLKPGPGEAQSFARTRPEPDKRFHYRYRAAGMAWEAAGFLADGSEQKARYLATAGTWLKARDADAARPFYKALLECCPDTRLGQAAQQARWFPDVPECEQE